MDCGLGGSYNRAVGLTPQVFALALLAALPVGTPDPALTRLFTPLAVPPGTYVVYTSSEPIETLTARLRELDPSPAPGAWTADPSRGARGVRTGGPCTTAPGWPGSSTASA